MRITVDLDDDVLWPSRSLLALALALAVAVAVAGRFVTFDQGLVLAAVRGATESPVCVL